MWIILIWSDYNSLLHKYGGNRLNGSKVSTFWPDTYTMTLQTLDNLLGLKMCFRCLVKSWYNLSYNRYVWCSTCLYKHTCSVLTAQWIWLLYWPIGSIAARQRPHQYPNHLHRDRTLHNVATIYVNNGFGHVAHHVEFLYCAPIVQVSYSRELSLCRHFACQYCAV